MMTRTAAGRGYQSLALACLSLAAGCTDVLSFLRLGNVFTSAMTGNTALLAIAIGRAQWSGASRAFAALLGFIVGVALSTIVSSRADAAEETAPVASRSLLLELVCIVGCAIWWSEAGDLTQRTLLYAVIVLSALGMGIQAATARLLNSSGISTVVFTTPLVHIVTSATGALMRLPRRPQPSAATGDRLYSFAAYGGGALLAALLLSRYFQLAVWLAPAAVLVALGCTGLSGAREAKRT